jgi:hypothetical protein
MDLAGNGPVTAVVVLMGALADVLGDVELVARIVGVRGRY